MNEWMNERSNEWMDEEYPVLVHVCMRLWKSVQMVRFFLSRSLLVSTYLGSPFW